MHKKKQGPFLCRNATKLSLGSLPFYDFFVQGMASPLTLQRQRSIAPCITDRDPLPDTPRSEPGSPRTGEMTPPPSRLANRGGSFRDRDQTTGGQQHQGRTSSTRALTSCEQIFLPRIDMNTMQTFIKDELASG